MLKDKVILITGAGDGIGRVAALTYASQGATVVLLGRTIEKLEAVYDEIENAGYPQAAIYPLNLEGAAPKDYDDLADILMTEFGKLDGLLHNAAELGTLTPLDQYDLDLWTRVMQVNLHAAYLLTRSCLPVMRKADNASVIFTTSSVGLKGRAYWGAYGISKFAVQGMMETLADELETHTSIRSNSIDPGRVRTAMRARAYPGEDKMTVPSAKSIMPTYLYLMSDASISENGQTLKAQS